jgi:DNA-3-methyladenine glycosylase II
MGLTADMLEESVAALAGMDTRLAAVVKRLGPPAPRQSPPGHETLMRAIAGQQVSTAAASSIWARLEAACGGQVGPEPLLALPDEALRGAGLSGAKLRYLRALSEALMAGTLDLAALPADDESAVAALTAMPGIGRWTAEIYLLFAEGRPDVFPAGDLAVQVSLSDILGEGGRAGEAATRRLAQPFAPHRGALAILAWHHYNSR